MGDYIAKDSQRFAEVTVERLFCATDILEAHPKAGQMVPEFENDSIRELIIGNYRIVYHIINEARIDIITVHNCARLLGNTFDFSEFDDIK